MITNLHVLSNTKITHSVEFKQELSLHKFIGNKKFLKSLEELSFKKLSFDVELFIIDSKKHKNGINDLDELSKLKSEFLVNLLLKKSILSYTKNINSIKLVTKFTGLHPVKITPGKGSWMLGHKLGHGIFNKNVTSNLCIISKIESLLQQNYNKFHKTNYSNYEPLVKGWDEVFKEMSSFKSAQECMIRPGNEEYIYELVAQYSMFGRTSFLFPSRIFSNQSEANNFARTIDQLIFESLTNVIGEIIYGD